MNRGKRGRQHQDRNGLMQRAEPDRHHGQKGRDAKRILQRDRRPKCQHGIARKARRQPAPRQHPGDERHHQHGTRQKPMIELHRGDICGEILERRRQIPIAFRHQPPIHERKGIVAEARANPGHKAARQHRQHRKPGGRMHQAAQGPGIHRAIPFGPQ